MNKKTALFILLALLVTACGSKESKESVESSWHVHSPQVERDLETIKEKGVLRAIVVYSATTYFLYRGQPMGYEYELLKRFADHLEVDLEILIAHDINQLIAMLNKGEGDIIAHGLTITQERAEYVDFTNYLYLTRQVLVQKKPDNWRQMKLHEIQKELISDPIELIGETISVRENSSYYDRLENLEQEIGGEVIIDTVPGSVSTQKIIKQVVEGEVNYTVADNNIAEINSTFYPVLDVDTDISFSQRVGWAVRKNSPALLEALNNWITEMRKDVDYYVIFNRYFKNKRSFSERAQSEFLSLNSGKISRFDSIVKKYASRINWDWRLLSSLIYQESQFDPHDESWAGAQGLMQLMPATAGEMELEDPFDPEENITAGTAYLNEMWERWSEIPDSLNRLMFTLASYNSGYSHVVDAQNLTRKNKGNPLVWDDEVEQWLLNLTYPKYFNDEVVKYGYVRGSEPVAYVERILNLFNHFETLIPE